MIIRNCTVDDVSRVRLFVDQCKPLDLHTTVTYWTLFNYFSNLCFLMLEEEKVIGFVSGVKSSLDKEVVYLWQVGVAKNYRGNNYASLLLDHFFKASKNLDCSKIQVSIAPENEPSYNAFFKYSKEHSYNISQVGELKYEDELTGKKEFEILYQIEI